MKSGEQDAFWLDSAKKFIRHAIALLRIVNPDGSPPAFAQINSLAGSMKRLSEMADEVADDDPRGDQCLAFFADEWSQLAENTRTSTQAYITNMVDPFLMRPYCDVFSGRSDLRISDAVDGGKILYVYMPIADKEAMSKVICTFVKLEFFREVLKRPDKERSSFFFCDEFQSFFTVVQGKGDADFFERSRQSNHANIIATQNIPALLKVASDRESVVQNLLGNCAVKVFLRNTDEKTNEYASKLFGQQVVAMAGSGMSQGHGRQGDSMSASSNRQYDQRVRQEEFINLAVPSRGRVSKEKLKWKVHPLLDDV
jgi:type IV secretory pathway TraG/TraD family ATPase VirD4